VTELPQHRFWWWFAAWRANPRFKKFEEEESAREAEKQRRKNPEAEERTRRAKEEAEARETARKPENLSEEALKRELHQLDRNRTLSSEEKSRREALSVQLMRRRQQEMLKKEDEAGQKRIEHVKEVRMQKIRKFRREFRSWKHQDMTDHMTEAYVHLRGRAPQGSTSSVRYTPRGAITFSWQPCDPFGSLHRWS
jgi:hypothetical protein